MYGANSQPSLLLSPCSCNLSLLPINPLSTSMFLFCDSVRLARAVCVSLGLALYSGDWWNPRPHAGEDTDSELLKALRIKRPLNIHP